MWPNANELKEASGEPMRYEVMKTADARSDVHKLLLWLNLLGVIALVTGMWWARTQLMAKRRPAVAGGIVDVSSFFLRTETTALFTVRYRYAVNGVAYERAEKIYTSTDRHGHHPLGMENWVLSPSVIVYYDPQNPARATIEAGLQTESIALVAFGLVTLGISLPPRFRRRRALQNSVNEAAL